MTDVFDILEARGFVEQVTDRGLVKELLQEGPVTCYIGFDPTARSLHAGSLLPIMSLVHMQRNGHRPIVVIGGGTALVGDPSGKTEARPILKRETIDENARFIQRQMSRFLDFSEGRALLVNNADWLADLNYIAFLREIGKHFSVNRMLTAESYRARLETGLSFIEFNYMLLQAYDFLHLYRTYDCRLQMGGNDQWGNILAGADLIRRMDGAAAHGVTLPLLTTACGTKMGKTHKGAVWLDPELTSPYDYYQYWINQDDRDVARFLAFFTLLPMEEVTRLTTQGDIRDAKRVLAYEATSLCHGKEEADRAMEASDHLFKKDSEVCPDSVPCAELQESVLLSGMPAYLLFEKVGLCKTRGEARRLITQGGGYVNGERVLTPEQMVCCTDLKEGGLLLRAGKKKYLRVSTTQA